jgi:hypothetical protein
MAGILKLGPNGEVIGVGPDYTPGPLVLGTGDGTNQVPRTDGGAVGSQTGTGSVNNTTAQGVGTSTNFSLASFESLILSDIASIFSSQTFVLALLVVAGYFAWKHFHKRR